MLGLTGLLRRVRVADEDHDVPLDQHVIVTLPAGPGGHVVFVETVDGEGHVVRARRWTEAGWVDCTAGATAPRE